MSVYRSACICYGHSHSDSSYDRLAFWWAVAFGYNSLCLFGFSLSCFVSCCFFVCLCSLYHFQPWVSVSIMSLSSITPSPSSLSSSALSFPAFHFSVSITQQCVLMSAAPIRPLAQWHISCEKREPLYRSEAKGPAPSRCPQTFLLCNLKLVFGKFINKMVIYFTQTIVEEGDCLIDQFIDRMWTRHRTYPTYTVYMRFTCNS